MEHRVTIKEIAAEAGGTAVQQRRDACVLRL